MNNAINKALYLLDKGEDSKAVEILENLVKTEEDICDIIIARCVLGEYYSFNKETHSKAKTHLTWIAENAKQLEDDDDKSDILSIVSAEIEHAKALMSKI